MRLLLVEDDKLIGEGIKKTLENNGDYTVDWVVDGKAGLRAILSMLQSQNNGERVDAFDAVVLDLDLPKLSGFDVLRAVRARNIRVPILILTANDNTGKRIEGLDLGCDDYLCKPFDAGELCARIRSLLRRSGFAPRAVPTITIKDVMLDPAARRVYKDNAPVDLSRREFVLLHLLFENVNKVLSRAQIIQNIYGWGDDIDSNALEVHVYSLRKKLGTNLIKTVRGVGYIVEDLGIFRELQNEQLKAQNKTAKSLEEN